MPTLCRTSLTHGSPSPGRTLAGEVGAVVLTGAAVLTGVWVTGLLAGGVGPDSAPDGGCRGCGGSGLGGRGDTGRRGDWGRCRGASGAERPAGGAGWAAGHVGWGGGRPGGGEGGRRGDRGCGSRGGDEEGDGWEAWKQMVWFGLKCFCDSLVEMYSCHSLTKD